MQYMKISQDIQGEIKRVIDGTDYWVVKSGTLTNGHLILSVMGLVGVEFVYDIKSAVISGYFDCWDFSDRKENTRTLFWTGNADELKKEFKIEDGLVNEFVASNTTKWYAANQLHFQKLIKNPEIIKKVKKDLAVNHDNWKIITDDNEYSFARLDINDQYLYYIVGGFDRQSQNDYALYVSKRNSESEKGFGGNLIVDDLSVGDLHEWNVPSDFILELYSYRTRNEDSVHNNRNFNNQNLLESSNNNGVLRIRDSQLMDNIKYIIAKYINTDNCRFYDVKDFKYFLFHIRNAEVEQIFGKDSAFSVEMECVYAGKKPKVRATIELGSIRTHKIYLLGVDFPEKFSSEFHIPFEKYKEWYEYQTQFHSNDVFETMSKSEISYFSNKEMYPSATDLYKVIKYDLSKKLDAILPTSFDDGAVNFSIFLHSRKDYYYQIVINGNSTATSNLIYNLYIVHNNSVLFNCVSKTYNEMKEIIPEEMLIKLTEDFFIKTSEKITKSKIMYESKSSGMDTLEALSKKLNVDANGKDVFCHPGHAYSHEDNYRFPSIVVENYKDYNHELHITMSDVEDEFIVQCFRNLRSGDNSKTFEQRMTKDEVKKYFAIPESEFERLKKYVSTYWSQMLNGISPNSYYPQYKDIVKIPLVRQLISKECLYHKNKWEVIDSRKGVFLILRLDGIGGRKYDYIVLMDKKSDELILKQSMDYYFLDIDRGGSDKFHKLYGIPQDMLYNLYQSINDERTEYNNYANEYTAHKTDDYYSDDEYSSNDNLLESLDQDKVNNIQKDIDVLNKALDSGKVNIDYFDRLAQCEIEIVGKPCPSVYINIQNFDSYTCLFQTKQFFDYKVNGSKEEIQQILHVPDEVFAKLHEIVADNWVTICRYRPDMVKHDIIQGIIKKNISRISAKKDGWVEYEDSMLGKVDNNIFMINQPKEFDLMNLNICNRTMKTSFTVSRTMEQLSDEFGIPSDVLLKAAGLGNNARSPQPTELFESMVDAESDKEFASEIVKKFGGLEAVTRKAPGGRFMSERYDDNSGHVLTVSIKKNTDVNYLNCNMKDVATDKSVSCKLSTDELIAMGCPERIATLLWWKVKHSFWNITRAEYSKYIAEYKCVEHIVKDELSKIRKWNFRDGMAYSKYNYSHTYILEIFVDENNSKVARLYVDGKNELDWDVRVLVLETTPENIVDEWGINMDVVLQTYRYSKYSGDADTSSAWLAESVSEQSEQKYKFNGIEEVLERIKRYNEKYGDSLINTDTWAVCVWKNYNRQIEGKVYEKTDLQIFVSGKNQYDIKIKAKTENTGYSANGEYDVIKFNKTVSKNELKELLGLDDKFFEKWIERVRKWISVIIPHDIDNAKHELYQEAIKRAVATYTWSTHLGGLAVKNPKTDKVHFGVIGLEGEYGRTYPSGTNKIYIDWNPDKEILELYVYSSQTHQNLLIDSGDVSYMADRYNIPYSNILHVLSKFGEDYFDYENQLNYKPNEVMYESIDDDDEDYNFYDYKQKHYFNILKKYENDWKLVEFGNRISWRVDVPELENKFFEIYPSLSYSFDIKMYDEGHEHTEENRFTGGYTIGDIRMDDIPKYLGQNVFNTIKNDFYNAILENNTAVMTGVGRCFMKRVTMGVPMEVFKYDDMNQEFINLIKDFPFQATMDEDVIILSHDDFQMWVEYDNFESSNYCVLKFGLYYNIIINDIDVLTQIKVLNSDNILKLMKWHHAWYDKSGPYGEVEFE